MARDSYDEADGRPGNSTSKRLYRRIVTGEDERGLSLVLRDAEMPFTDVRSVHWFTEYTADALRDAPSQALSRMPMKPPPGSTTFQIVVLSPERPNVAPEKLDAFYERVFAGTATIRGDTKKHPGMHRTSTIDYVVVLEGELTLILGHEDVTLKPFDTVVQRGTEHAWANRTNTRTTFAVVTIDLAIAGVTQPDTGGTLEFAALYGLTPAETEVALALAHGERLPSIARKRGVSTNTIRTHLANLRSKLGVNSQAEIIRTILLYRRIDGTQLIAASNRAE